MTDKEEVIAAAETLKRYCDSTQVFACGCMKCPLEYVCETIDIHVSDKLSTLMNDIAHEVKYSDD